MAGIGRKAQSLKLKYVVPKSSNGAIRVSLDQDLIDQGAKEWECSLVGCMLDTKLLAVVVGSIARRLWAS